MFSIYQNGFTDQASSGDFPIMREFVDYLPSKPYCTDILGGLLIRPKERAIKCVYVQYNPIHRAYWLVFDIDMAEPRYWDDEWKLPTPNIEVRNTANNHYHLFYLIDPAVYTLRQARLKPLELMAMVDRGLTELLEADPGYGKLIAKNPLHKQWLTFIWRERKWGLTELLDYIPQRIQKRKVKPLEMIGLGRNCTVFELSRTYAYSEWRRLKFDADQYDRFFQAVYEYGMNMNSNFNVPMLEREVKCIVRSIAKWTSRHLTKAGFVQWGDIRRANSIAVRKTKSQARAEEVKALYAGGKTQQQIAAILGISLRQVRNLLLE